MDSFVGGTKVKNACGWVLAPPSQLDELHELILQTVEDVVIVVGFKGEIENLNRKAEQLLGLSAQQVRGKELASLLQSHCHERDLVHKVLAEGEECFFEYSQTDSLVIRGRIIPILDVNGKCRRAVIIGTDLTELIKHQRELADLKNQDQLTKLYSRSYLLKRLHKLNIEQSGGSLGIIFINVPNLHVINDSLGFEFGDRVLLHIAKLLTNNTLPTDLVARWSNSDFIIIMMGGFQDRIKGLVKNLEEVVIKDPLGNFPLNLVLGWEEWTDKEDDLYSVFRKAKGRMQRRRKMEANALENSTVSALMGVLYVRSTREEQHSLRVSELCVQLAKELKLGKTREKDLALAGLFHDLGKVAIDSTILNKAGPLNDREWKEMKTHPLKGSEVLNLVPGMDQIAEAVLSHHERYDGSGYPRGLKGTEIPLMARVIAVADSYDAMISERPYKQSKSEQEALAELQKESGTSYDPLVVEAFGRVAQARTGTPVEKNQILEDEED